MQFATDWFLQPNCLLLLLVLRIMHEKHVCTGMHNAHTQIMTLGPCVDLQWGEIYYE